jgi:hypothetical protein
MRSSRSVHDEVKPLLEYHARSRLFSIVLSKRGVRFERVQSSVAFLTHENLLRMTESVGSLDIFSRTRKKIRSLKWSIQIEPPTAPPSGLIPVLEPTSMWIFSLLANADALRYLLVEFHLSHDFITTELDQDDGREMNIGELIGLLLGSRAAAHGQKVMNVASASELQAVRFVVLQKDKDSRKEERRVNSFRWERSGQIQPGPQLSTQVVTVSQVVLPQHRQQISQDVYQQSLGELAYEITRPSTSRLVPQSVQYSASDTVQPARHNSDHPQSPAPKPTTTPADQLPRQPARQQDDHVRTLASKLTATPIAQPPRQPASQQDDHVRPLAIKLATTPTPLAEAQYVADEREKASAIKKISSPAQQVASQDRSPAPERTEFSSPSIPARPAEDKRQPSRSPVKASPSPEVDSDAPQSTLKRRREWDDVLDIQKKRKIDREDRVLIPVPAVSSPVSTSTAVEPTIDPAQNIGQQDDDSTSIQIGVVVKDEEFEIQSLQDTRIRKGVLQIQVKWHGYEELTWEPRTSLMEDVPDMVKAFEESQKKAAWKAARRAEAKQKESVLQNTSTGMNAPSQRPQGAIDTPQAAAVRLKQWNVQQAQPPPSKASAPPQQSHAPKPPVTAYFLYMKANRPSIYEDLCKVNGNPELVTQSRIAEACTHRWRALSVEERGPWDRIYAKRVAIYHIQMEAYNSGRRIPSQDEARALVESRNKQTTIMDLS